MSISFPFRIDPAGSSVATNQDGSDQEVTDAVAVTILTQPGERPLRPGFGIDPLPFTDGLDRGTLQLQLAENGWDHITITDIRTGEPRDGRVESTVTWERNL